MEVRQKRYGACAIAVAASLFALCGVMPAGAADPPTAKELYRQALVAMNDLTEPAFVTYRLEGTSEGLRAEMTTQGGCAHLVFGFGSNHDRWTLRHRTEDGRTEMVDDADGRRYVVYYDRSIANFDPTWLTTYRTLRNPIPRACAAPETLTTPTPRPAAPTPTSAPALKVIGTVVALGPGIYNVEDRGAAACPNGDPGRALHLWSRTNDRRHQLSDVIVELRSMRFCMIRFGARSMFGAGIFEQHFADVGGYWLQTGGVVEVTARVGGIAASHGVWRYRLFDMQFPSALPPEDFATPAH